MSWAGLRVLIHDTIVWVIPWFVAICAIFYAREMVSFLMRHLTATIAVLYAAAVVVAFAHMKPSESRDYVAVHDLRLNHRVVEADLQRPAGRASSYGFYLALPEEIVGKYVKTEIRAGCAIKATNLADGLDMKVKDEAKRAIAFPLPANSRMVETLDAGSSVQLTGQDEGKTPRTFTADVHGIFCVPGKAADGCYPILLLGEADATVVLKNQGTFQLLLLPRAFDELRGECK